METSLHRQLKALYAPDAAANEVSIAGFRIDAVADGRLIEIQQASLGALRDKTRRLLEDHCVTIVKPLAHVKRIIHVRGGNGLANSSRLSPKHESWLHLFVDLVHFVDVFPHRRLMLEVVLTEQEELRTPRTSRRRFGKNYRVADRRLTSVVDRKRLRSVADLVSLLPPDLPRRFTTADLASKGGVPRWLAQKVAYCLRKTGGIEVEGKERNTVVYRLSVKAKNSTTFAAKKGRRAGGDVERRSA